MIKFTLYSEEHPNGLVLSQIRDENTVWYLKSYYKNLYRNDKFKVTIKRPRKLEEYFCGGYQR